MSANYLTAKELAQLLGVGTEQVRLLRRHGVFPEAIAAGPIHPIKGPAAWLFPPECADKTRLGRRGTSGGRPRKYLPLTTLKGLTAPFQVYRRSAKRFYTVLGFQRNPDVAITEDGGSIPLAELKGGKYELVKPTESTLVRKLANSQNNA